jgi:hypothetical protein
MRYAIWAMLIVLVVLQQSGWAADRSDLLFGFLPAGLMYHGIISLAAGLVWLLATIYVWPVDEESAPTMTSTGERAIPVVGDEQ